MFPGYFSPPGKFPLPFYRATLMHSADYAVARCLSAVHLSVCLSVRLSVTRRYCVNSTRYISSTFFSPAGSPTIQFCPYQTGWQYSDGDPLTGRVECKGVSKKHDFFTNIGLYLGTDARSSHSYYGRRIGNRTETFKWYYFGWSWVTSNPDFKVTILLNVKQLKNGTR